MREPLSKAERKADHYRKEAVRYHELAKFARPAYLGDFYRRIAVRYLFMAEDVTKWAERQPEAVPTNAGSVTDAPKTALLIGGRRAAS